MKNALVDKDDLSFSKRFPLMKVQLVKKNGLYEEKGMCFEININFFL